MAEWKHSARSISHSSDDSDDDDSKKMSMQTFKINTKHLDDDENLISFEVGIICFIS